MPTPVKFRTLRLGQPEGIGERAIIDNRGANPLLVDPTRTTLLRNQFRIAILNRFRLLRRHVVEFLTVIDALGLKPKPTLMATSRQYEFLTDLEKLKAFNDWFKEQSDADIFRAVEGTSWIAPAGSIAQGPWTMKYVETAYKRGVINAYFAAHPEETSQESYLRSVFGAPERLSKMQLLATRSYELLKGITAEMGAQMNRILAQGMVEGRGVLDIANEMSDQIEGMSETRALRIARTEIIYAHAEGQLDGFEELGIEELQLKAEWVTAGDNRVCPLCGAQEGTLFTVAEARGLIPLHPNCRCSWSLADVRKEP